MKSTSEKAAKLTTLVRDYQFQKEIISSPAFDGKFPVYIQNGHKDGSTLLVKKFDSREDAENFINTENPNEWAFGGKYYLIDDDPEPSPGSGEITEDLAKGKAEIESGEPIKVQKSADGYNLICPSCDKGLLQHSEKIDSSDQFYFPQTKTGEKFYYCPLCKYQVRESRVEIVQDPVDRDIITIVVVSRKPRVEDGSEASREEHRFIRAFNRIKSDICDRLEFLEERGLVMFDVQYIRDFDIETDSEGIYVTASLGAKHIESSVLASIRIALEDSGPFTHAYKLRGYVANQKSERASFAVLKFIENHYNELDADAERLGLFAGIDAKSKLEDFSFPEKFRAMDKAELVRENDRPVMIEERFASLFARAVDILKTTGRPNFVGDIYIGTQVRVKGDPCKYFQNAKIVEFPGYMNKNRVTVRFFHNTPYNKATDHDGSPIDDKRYTDRVMYIGDLEPFIPGKFIDLKMYTAPYYFHARNRHSSAFSEATNVPSHPVGDADRVIADIENNTIRFELTAMDHNKHGVRYICIGNHFNTREEATDKIASIEREEKIKGRLEWELRRVVEIKPSRAF